MDRTLTVIILTLYMFNLVISATHAIKRNSQSLGKNYILEDFFDEYDLTSTRDTNHKDEYEEQNKALYYEDIGTKRIGPKYFCRNKKNEGQYEHRDDCHKYWHCLYVGTIFEIALERKCPIGTMFHPLERKCEISTQITCTKWRKSIYGESYVEPELNKITNEFLNNYYMHELQNQYTDQYYQSLKKGKKLRSKVIPYYPPRLRAFNETTTRSSTMKTTTKAAQMSSLVLLEKLRDLLETKAIDNSTETSSYKNETNAGSEISFSPLDRLLIEKIEFLKSNKLNKTQMDKHLNLIKHIFEFKNNSMNEIEEFISDSSSIKQLNSKSEKVKTNSTKKTIANIHLPVTSTTTVSYPVGSEDQHKKNPGVKHSNLIGRLRTAEMAQFALNVNSKACHMSSLNLLLLLNILVLLVKFYL